MKKNKKAKITAQVIRNTKRTMKTHKRAKAKIIHTPELITTWGPGPSRCIEYKDGKVISFNSWSKKVHQKDHITEIAKTSIDANKAIKLSKKEHIKKILVDLKYDPKRRYTRSEKKRFTRIIKNTLVNNCKFRYIIKRSSDNNPMHDYDFETNYLQTGSKIDAVKKLHKLIEHKYIKIDDFTGASLIDLSDNVSWYYPKSSFTSKIAA